MLPRRHQLLHRLADTKGASGGPPTYNKSDHSVEVVISRGSPVKCVYGTEVLRISPQSVDLSRLREGGIPLLDHHSQAGIDQVLGRVADAWIEGGAVMGRIVFAQTEQGRKAEGMVARGELTGISAGYCVDAWTITDADGDVVDERDVRWDDDLTFHGDALAVVRGVACRCACRWRVDGAFAWGSSRHVGRHEGPHGSEAGNGRPHG